MRLRSLRSRIILAYVVLIVLGFGGLAIFAGGQLATAAQEDFEQQVEAQTALIARGLTEVLESFMEGEISQPSLQGIIDSYAEQSGGRVTLVHLNGQAWLDSETLPVSDDFLVHPEIVAAIDGRVTHETRPSDSGRLEVFSAAPIREDDQIITIISLAVPVEGAAANLQQRWLSLGAGVLALTLAAVLLSAWLAATLTRPLRDLQATAMRIAAGEFIQSEQARRWDEIGELASAFNTMSAEVESMLEEQRAFASNAAHELRTPLTTILLRTEALNTGRLDAPLQAQYIDEVDQEARRLSGLVEDLMLLARLDAGRAELGQEQIDLLRMIESLGREMQARCEARGITITTDAAPALPPVQASLNHLRVVLRNLLDNAIKYSPEGGPIRWVLRTEANSLLIRLQDSGQGIASQDLPLVVKRFYRADHAHSRKVPGSGLGLALVYSTLQLYGADFQIESPGPGRGTTVTIRWPLRLEGS